MDILKIEATDETPNVELDPVNNILVFSGKSLPEDVRSFYTPVLEWLEQYTSAKKENVTVEFKMDYFNTASSKIILDILLILENIHLEGGSLIIKWYYKTKDVDMKEAGEEYAEIVEIPFEFVAV